MVRLRTILGSAGAFAALGSLASAQSFALNEIYASHAGTDDQEYVEIIGPAGASLDGIFVLIVEGEGGSVGTLDRAWNLSGLTMPMDGYFVLGNTAVANNDFDIGADNRIENGTETVYLVSTTDAAGLAALEGTDVTAAAGPGFGTTTIPTVSNILDVIGLVNGDWPVEDTIFDTMDTVGPDGDFLPAGIFRPGDFPAGWCQNDFLDFDDEANLAQMRTPGETNTTECSDPPPPAEMLHLNEIYASHAGTDDQEYIELIGTPGGGLTGYLVLVLEGQGGGAGTVDRVWNLAGLTVPDDGFFVLGDSAVANVDFDIGADNRIENGTETFYLVFADDPAAVEALDGTDVTDTPGPGDGTTTIPTVATIVDVVAMVDSDYPVEDTVFDGATVTGPDGDFFPAGIFRFNDYPFDWCTAFFLDFDDEANAAQPRNPGEANIGDCSLECFLVFGNGPGFSSWGAGSHTFPAQVDQVIESYPVLQGDTPLLPLPQVPTGPLGSSTIFDFNRPVGPNVYYAQVLMYSPLLSPWDPERFSSGVQFIVIPGRGIFSRPYGDADGIEFTAEIVIGPDGNEYLTFPFSVEGF